MNAVSSNKLKEAPISNSSKPYRNKEIMEWKFKLLDKLLSQIDLLAVGKLDPDVASSKIRDAALELMQSESAPLSSAVRKELVSEIVDEIMGLGPLEPLLRDPTVADIMVNGYDMVFVERHGRIEPTEIRFRDNNHVLNVLDRIVSRIGRRIDESNPMVDARLEDGSRVNAIIPPLAIDGPMISIRRFSIDNLTVDNLIELGSLAPQAADIIKKIVLCHLNILISGGTGSGKTTLLNILSGFIPSRERIVTIEDSAELQLQQPHVVRLETRPPNIEGKGEVTSTDLVRNTLRMRPDRIIVGEVRGGEAFDMLQAMNTGHDGSLTTVHANSPRDALTRIESMVTMTGMKLPVKAIRNQISSAINVVIQLERMEDGIRRVVSIQEVLGMEGEVITMAEIFTFKRRGLDDEGKVVGEFLSTGVVPKFADQLKRRGYPLDLTMFRMVQR